MNPNIEWIGAVVVDAIRKVCPRSILQDHEFEQCARLARQHYPNRDKAVTAVMAELERIEPFVMPYPDDKVAE